MADITPFRALHYDLARTGGLAPVVAPPYDVIDPQQREALLARSPHNVVAIDLPQGEDPYGTAAATLADWRADGVVVSDGAPALWALEQDYTGPDGLRRTRHGIFARVKVEDYGPGRIRPHERTHPGPKEDRLRLTRATHANLSPIFSLYDGDAWSPLAPHLAGEPLDAVTDEDGTTHRLWRVADPEAIAAARAALAPAELLIADGHHRYETARVFAQEPGAPAGADHVLMCLVSLGDPGLTIFPTHRLLTGLDDARRVALRDAIMRDWEVEEVALEDLEPEPAADGHVRIGYLDAHHGRPLRLTLKDPATADAALPGRPDAYRRLDTAVTEALLLQGALGMSEDDISHFRGLDYARSTPEAIERVRPGDVQAGLFMGPAPVELVREVAAAGEVMPPKSTYFFPKVLTGLVFNPLDGD
ncbi:MAG: DUF1015 domain-containing protein [Solirubrobacteraceae bacterium]